MGTLAIFLPLFLGLAAGVTTACTPGERLAVETHLSTCSKYFECDSNKQLVEKTCGVDSSFDRTTKSCQPSWKVECVGKQRNCEDGKVYADPASCRMYYSCVGGRLSRQLCPVLHVFEPATGKCSYGFRCPDTECAAWERRAVAGNCTSYEICDGGKWARKSCTGGLTYNALSEKCEMGICTQCPQGALTKGTACNRYQECELGLWTEKVCPTFHRFDPNKNRCVWYFQYTCPKDNFLNSLTITEDTCKNGDARAEEDCSKYSICTKGKWDLTSCPEGYLFDSEKLECMHVDEARCLSCPEDHADPETCGAYFECVRGTKVPKTCGFMKRWDGVRKKCVLMGANCFPGERCSDEGKKIPTSDCKFYEECISGRYYKRACGFSKVFVAARSECAWDYPWSRCQAVDYFRECAEGEKKLLDCTHYAKCLGGKWTQFECNPGETFIGGECIKGECVVQKQSCQAYRINGVDLDCVQGEVFDETARKCVTGVCGRKKRSLPDCESGEVRAVEGDCQAYEVCVDGQFAKKRCSDCMNYSPEQEMCKYIYSYPCNRTTTPEPTPQPQPTTQQPTPQPQPTTQDPTPQPQPTTQDPTPQPQPTTQDPTPQPQPTTQQPTPQPQPTTQQPTTPDPTTEPPTCVEGEKKPNKTNCKKYYVCKNAQFVEESCAWLKKFDSVDLNCVFTGARCAS